MINDLVISVVDNLNATLYFSEFKFRKKDCRFIKKTTDGFNVIELQFWDGYDSDRDCRALVIKPLYLKRFDVLHKWFEKYSFKALADQRDNYSIGFDGGMINGTLQFYFRLDKVDFNTDFNKFKNEVIQKSKEIFESIRSINDLYDTEIIPILEGKKELPNVGADWVFEYLKLCLIVDSKNYNNLKSIILKQVEIMYKSGEPNIKEYYLQINHILSDIETIPQ